MKRWQRWIAGLNCSAVLVMMPALAWSEESGRSFGFVSGDAAGCKVWAPPQLGFHDYVPRYTGECHDGKAEGQGKVQWLYRYADLKVRSSWEGYFHEGVFVGAHPFKFPITPEDRSNGYIVSLGSVAAGQVVAFAGNAGDGLMDLCAARMLGLSINGTVAVTDDAAVKKAMIDTGAALQSVCTQTARSVQVNIYATPFAIDASGQRTAAVADSLLDMQAHTVTSYSNEASNMARSKARQAAMQAEMAAAQQQFVEFSRRNGVTTWVTAAQLDENPFRYEGRVVGVVVVLQRMATRDTAIVSGAIEDDGAILQLRGVTPEFPGRRHGVLLAVKVGAREPLAGDAPGSGTLTTVTLIDSRACADEQCNDLMGWARGANRIDWGAPYTAK